MWIKPHKRVNCEKCGKSYLADTHVIICQKCLGEFLNTVEWEMYCHYVDLYFHTGDYLSPNEEMLSYAEMGKQCQRAWIRRVCGIK
jgi:uncharacterized protein (DUF1919 family)